MYLFSHVNLNYQSDDDYTSLQGTECFVTAFQLTNFIYYIGATIWIDYPMLDHVSLDERPRDPLIFLHLYNKARQNDSEFPAT